MKIKFAILATIMSLVAVTFASCGEDEKPTPPDEKIPTLRVTVVESGSTLVTPTTVTINVTPLNYNGASDLYFLFVMDDEEFGKYGSDSKIQGYVTNLLANLAPLNPDLTKAEIVEELAYAGRVQQQVWFLTPDTSYHAFAVGVNTEGKVTTGFFSAGFETPAQFGEAPVFESVTLTPGDATGLYPATQMTVSVKSKEAWYGRMYFNKKAEIETAVANGDTHEGLLNMFGMDVTGQGAVAMNKGEFAFPLIQCEASTEYMILVQIVSEGGKIALTNAIGTTKESDKPSSIAARGELSSVLSDQLVTAPRVKGLSVAKSLLR